MDGTWRLQGLAQVAATPVGQTGQGLRGHRAEAGGHPEDARAGLELLRHFLEGVAADPACRSAVRTRLEMEAMRDGDAGSQSKQLGTPDKRVLDDP